MVFLKTRKRMKRITVTVDPDDYQAIDQLAKRRELSTSWLIRRSMREFLDRYRDHAPDPLTPPEARSVR